MIILPQLLQEYHTKTPVYMYGKKNKKNKKNYYKKSVFSVTLIKSVGIHNKCLPNYGFEKCHVTENSVT